MGLSASQARLLSLTSRISQNELRAEQVTRSKQALAQETADLTKKYVNSLNANELTYAIYDQDGEKTCMELTGAALSQYAPLKNQYALVNAHGQVLVSELDAGNYEKSADINEFLACYGIDPIPTGEYKRVKNPDYDAAYEEWQKSHGGGPTSDDEWEKAHDEWEIEHGEWESSEPNPDDYWIDDPNGEPGKTKNNWDLFERFVEGAEGGCFTITTNPCSGSHTAVVHFFDVMEHLLEPGTHTTSSGETFEIYFAPSGGDTPGNQWWEEGSQREDIDNFGGSPGLMAEIREAMKGKHACGHNHESGEAPEYIDCPTSWGGCGGQHEIDCNCDERCNGDQLLVDKLEDLFYDFYKKYRWDNKWQGDLETEEFYDDDPNTINDPEALELYRRYMHFFFHDLKGAMEEEVEDEPEKIFDEEGYDKDHGEWENSEPEEPQKPEPSGSSEEEEFNVPEYIDKEIMTYNDNDEAQWYVNLWHRMNGESQEKDGYTTAQYGTTNAISGTFTNQKRWDILEDGLMNNAKWLKYALETCAVTIERVEFADPNDMGTGIRKTKWNSIIYTNAIDIGTQTNQKIAAKNEAEFDRKQKALNAKDKQYDSILKLLDTEHNTLLQEYETAKSAVTKNTERTLKLYS